MRLLRIAAMTLAFGYVLRYALGHWLNKVNAEEEMRQRLASL